MSSDDRTLSVHAAAVDDTLPADGSQCPLEPGMRLAGRYTIHTLLGRGGMGTVYLASDDALDGKRVALKLVPSEVAGPGLEALRREVLLAQEVTHPNVCRIYDLEHADGRWMIKMEYVAGETLSKRLARGPLPIDEALAIARGITDGLGAVHARRVIHRDLKPSNVMLDDSGRVVLMDFGIARIATPEHNAGDIAGTPMYMAPEQVRGERIDARADLYALGCVLHHLLVGEVPFPAKTPSDAAQLQLDRSPTDPRRRRPQTPAWLARATLALLAKDPDARPPDAAAVRRLLAGPRWRVRALAAAALVLALAAIGLVWFALGRSPVRAWQPQLRFLPGFDENSYAPAISPDSSQLAYTTDRAEKGTFQLHLAALDGTGDRVVALPERSPLAVRWIDGGRSLVFMDNHDWNLYRTAAEGGPAEKVADHAWATGCGDQLLIAEPAPGCDACYRLVLRGGDGGQREVARFPPGGAPYDPTCDRDGGRVVFAYAVGDRDVYQPADLWLLDLASGERRALTDDRARNTHPSFTPDGGSVVFTSQRGGRMNLWELPLDGGAPVQLTAGEGNDVGADVSSDGRTVAFDIDITSMPLFAHAAGGLGAPRRLVPSRPMLGSLSASSDGVMVAIDDAPVEAQVVAIDVASGTVTPLATGAIATATPDGREAVYATDADRSQVLAVPIAGGAPRVVGSVDGRVRHLAVGPDGVVHALVKNGEGTQAWRLPPDGAPSREASAPWVLLVPSPDGHTVLWLRHDGADRWIGVFAVPGATPAIDASGFTLSGKLAVTFDARGTSVVYQDGNGVYRVPVAGGPPALLFEASELYGLAQSPDGATVYTAEVVARVQRATITNFADRPRP